MGRNRWIALVTLVAIAQMSPGLLLAQVRPRETDEEVNIRLYRQTSSAVVAIETPTTRGSGSIIDPSGLIVTNAHVVRGASQITVTLSDRRRFRGTVLASSRMPDLALLRIEDGVGTFPTLTLGSWQAVQVGQRAFAIGNPFGLAGTLTTGIISRIDRDRQWVQTDAPINPGNSGSPLLNSRGELIGINTMIFTRGQSTTNNTGVGLAIAVTQVQEFVAAALQGKIAPEAPPRITQLPLNGRFMNDRLTQTDDLLPDGSFYRIYQFQGQAGQRITLEMQSADLDSYLVLADAHGRQIAEDDDSGGGKNARITVLLPVTGSYTLYANAYERGELGRFQIRARVSDGVEIFSERGILGDRSQILERDGSFFNIHTFSGRAGQVIQVVLSSQEFHPYLAVLDPNRRLLKEHDGLPDRRNATLTVELPANGTYRIVANAYDRRGRGSYEIRIRQLPSATP